MKPIEIQTVEQTDAQETVYPGLQAAQKALEAAMAEQKHYSSAISQLLAAYNFRVREAQRLREQLRQKATQFALDGKLSDFEPELSVGCNRIVTMIEEIDRLGYAQQRLETQQVQHDREVTSCMESVSKMENYAHSYEQAKCEYSGLYREATAFEATRAKFSASGVPRGNRLLVVKRELDRLASFLGCEGDLRSFIRDLEAES